MKKLFLSLAVIASVSLFSCGGNKAEKEADAAEAVEPAATEAVEEGACAEADSCCADTCVAAVVEEAVAAE